MRARDLGIVVEGAPGPMNALTDVTGIEVGVSTIVEGDDIRTGVTAIHPRGRDDDGDPCAAGMFSLNGNGELTGSHWVAESGTMTGPVCLTNTNAVGTVHAAVVEWDTRRRSPGTDSWLLPIIGETWDGHLNAISRPTVTAEHVVAALDRARGGPMSEGSVGGGTGMICYGFKGGNGTASRVVPVGERTYTVGAFVQANFGSMRNLTVDGIPVGRILVDEGWTFGRRPGDPAEGAGSVIVVVITDAPLLPDQCRALARRAPLGLARTGTHASHHSGDIVLALSTANPGGFSRDAMGLPGSGRELDQLVFVPWGRIDPLFEAVVQATEEAVLNALVDNAPMTGRGRLVEALPHDALARWFERRPPGR